MKLLKYGILIVSVSMLVLSSGVVSASTETIDDAQNDVYKIDLDKPVTQQYTENIGDQPNVDIDKVTCVIADGKLTVTLELVSDGVVQHEIDMDYSYNVQFTTSDGGMYLFMVNYAGEGGQGTGPATPADENAGGTLDISKNVLEVVWTFNGEATVKDLTADASYGPTDRITYRDVAEEVDEDEDDDDTDDDTTDDDTDDDDDDSNGNVPRPNTPGFEIVAVLAAVAVALILVKRRK
jgi:hypothetical protein